LLNNISTIGQRAKINSNPKSNAKKIVNLGQKIKNNYNQLSEYGKKVPNLGQYTYAKLI
jgi:hypothetical protein